jgi:hypothetical protein
VAQPARSRWPAGTLAAAGTTPARTMNAYPTLVISQGHHPANHRSAIPTRAYESGSGHGHDAAPAGHPHPPRPPPCPAIPPGPCPRRPSSAPIRDMGTPRPAHNRPSKPAPKPPRPPKPRRTNLQKLDEPLHMSAQIRSPRAKNPQLRGMRQPKVHDREPRQAEHGALHQPGQSFAQLPERYGPVIRHLSRHDQDHCVTAMTAGMSEEVRLVTRTAIPLPRSTTCWALRAR